MFNQNSFSIDSGNNHNNSFNFNSPQKRVSNHTDSFRNNEEDYEFGANLANYNFAEVPAANSVKPVTFINQLKMEPRMSKQNAMKKPQRFSNNQMDKISEKPSVASLMSDEQKPRGLLKSKMRVDYAFDHRKVGQVSQSDIVLSSKPTQKFSNYSEIGRSQISANLFSCMDAPEYERDFEISPKVIARKYF